MRRLLLSAMGGWLAVAGVSKAQTPAKMESPYAGTPAAKSAPKPAQNGVKQTSGTMGMLPASTTAEALPIAPTQNQLAASPMMPLTPTIPGAQAAPAQPAPPMPVAPPPAQAPAAPAQGNPANSQPVSSVTNFNGQCGQIPSGNCDTNGTPCGPQGRLWVDMAYLYWVTRGVGIPSLVTTSPPGTPRAQAGVLGAPGTTTLFGNENINNEWRSGFKIDTGYWLDCCQTCGIEAGYFYLGRDTDPFTATSTGSPILSRPFFNAATGLQDAQLVAYPNDPTVPGFPANLLSGSVQVNSATDFYGFNVGGRKNLCCDNCSRTDLILGYRYLNLQDDINVTENLTTTGVDPAAPLPIGTNFIVYDSFSARNTFNGGYVGLAGEKRRGDLYFGYRGQIAFGNTRSQITIDGSTQVTLPGGAPTTAQGGLLAQGTNIGTYTHDNFAVVPEVDLRVGYYVSPHIRAYVGYNFLYWSSVMRAAAQIDTTVNPTQIPPGVLVGDARPAYFAKETDFWAQGFSFGAEFRY